MPDPTTYVARGESVRPASIIAHRGSSYLAPENTLAALRLGWQETTTCEVDVHLTLDGRLLVIHDESTRRTTGVNLKVSGHSLSELQKLDAGSFKGIEWQGEKLPALEEALAAMPADKRLLIEIKGGPEAAPELARVIHASGKAGQVQLHSFNHPACLEAKAALPAIPVDLLVASRQNLVTGIWGPSLDEVILLAKQAGLAGLGMNHTPFLHASTVEKIHAAGLKLNVWTVDRADEAKKLIEMGADGIITNRPGWLRAQLAGLLPGLPPA